MRHFGYVFVGLLGASALAGCGAQGTVDGTDEAEVFTSTSVYVDSNGEVKTETVPITLAQELRENAARAALVNGEPAQNGAVGEAQQAIGYDSACSGSSLWIYDNGGGSDGTGNRVCFKYDASQGDALLGNYCRTGKICIRNSAATWYHQVRSYWPGNFAGAFWSDTYNASEHFNALPQGLTHAGAYAQTAKQVGQQIN
jgi:hypothetical protein